MYICNHGTMGIHILYFLTVFLIDCLVTQEKTTHQYVSMLPVSNVLYSYQLILYRTTIIIYSLHGALYVVAS